MSKLTINNRIRHAEAIEKIMPRHVPKKYYPIERIGRTRTADGAAFILRDPSKVGKIIFFSTDRVRRQIMKEFYIGERMGQIGVGPRVYAYYKIKYRNTSKVPSNLLASGTRATKHAIYIIMQNLAYGVSKLQTLSQYVSEGKTYPMGQIQSVYRRMINNGRTTGSMLMHGNLHADNILIRTFKNGHIRPYIIDYGRSIYIPYSDTVSKNANYLLLSGYTPHPTARYYFISPKTHTPRAPNAALVLRNARILGFEPMTKPVNMKKRLERAKKRNSPQRLS